jgi:hypothetical protein
MTALFVQISGGRLQYSCCEKRPNHLKDDIKTLQILCTKFCHKPVDTYMLTSETLVTELKLWKCMEIKEQTVRRL